VLDGHSHLPRQPFPVWHNLYQPQLKACPFMHHQIWCTDDTHGNFRCSGFLSPLWEWKHRWTAAAEVGKILFVEKRRERLHSGECRGTRKPVVPWVGLGIGFIAFLSIAWGQRCLSDADRSFLGRRGVSLTTYHLLGPPAVRPSGTQGPRSFYTCLWQC
jgi:hypothetical protein